MTTHTRVAIVGGGIIGCSILYYLTKIGWSDIILLEKSELTAGATWHAAGNVVLYSSNPVMNELDVESWRLYREFEKETGEDLGFHRTGMLHLASNAKTLKRYEYRLHPARYAGIDFSIIDAKRAGDLHPLMKLDGLVGAVHLPDEGYMDPTITTHAFARAARSNGARIKRQAEVVRVSRDAAGAWSLETADETIVAETLILCAGFWSPEFSPWLNTNIPIVPIERQYIVTEAVPEIATLGQELPLIHDVDGPYYMRQEGKSLLCGVHEAEVPFCFLEGVPKTFGQELLVPDLDRGTDSLAAAMARVPALERAGIKTVVCGPTSRTPDLQGLVGPLPGVQNAYVAAGFTNGVSQAAIVGKVMAAWISTGDPGIDTAPISVGRFGRYANSSYVRSRLKEVHTWGRGELLTERLGGRPARTSPLFPVQKQKGARFEAISGWECAMHFGADRQSIRAALDKGVGIVDLTAMAKLQVSGDGAGGFLSRLFTRAAPVVGEIASGLMLTGRGNIAAQVSITSPERDMFLLYTPLVMEADALSWLERNAKGAGSIKIQNVTGQKGTLLIAGSRRTEFLEQLTSAVSGSDHSPKVIATDIAYSPVEITRSGLYGPLGWEVHHQLEYQIGLYDALINAGKRFDIPVVDLGYSDLDSLRLELGWPTIGHEFGFNMTPQAAGLEHLIDWSHTFLGESEVRDNAKARAGKKIFRIATEADSNIIAGDPVMQGGVAIGLIKTAGLGPDLKPIAFAVLDQSRLDRSAPLFHVSAGEGVKTPINPLQ